MEDDPPAVFLEGVLEAFDGLPSKRKIVGDRRDALVLQHLGRVFPKRMVRLAARPARPDDPWRPLPLGQVIGGDDRIERRDLLLVDVVPQGVARAREQGTHEQIHFIKLHELPGLGQRRRRRPLFVLGEHLDLPAGDPVARLTEPQGEPVRHVAAVRREHAGQRDDQADLDRALLRDSSSTVQRNGERRAPGHQHVHVSAHRLIPPDGRPRGDGRRPGG